MCIKSASEARERSRKIRETKIPEQLEEISELIDEAVELGSEYINYHGTLFSETWKKLEYEGYLLSADKDSIMISWFDDD